MKSLRRSFNDRSSQPSAPIPMPMPAYANPLSRPSEKVAPPKKVIKAMRSHRSANPQELSYTLGDFWYVTGEREAWYEALSRCFSLSELLNDDQCSLVGPGEELGVWRMC